MERKLFISVFVFVLIQTYSFASSFEIFFYDGSSKSCIYNEKSQELIIDHVIQPVKKVITNIDKSKIKKVKFSFVMLDGFGDDFWNKIDSCESLQMNFTEVSNLDFVKRFPNLKILSFHESNQIHNVEELDFSLNQCLEYIELEEIKMNIKTVVNIPETVKYFVICYSQINEKGYEEILKQISNNTILVIDASQKEFVNKQYLECNGVLSKIWKEYNIY